MLESQVIDRRNAATYEGQGSSVSDCASAVTVSKARHRNVKCLFPFSAVVGQDQMKLGLILSAIDPAIGGVLIMGDRGSGKSTCVRGLAALLPTIDVVSGCAFNCDPTSGSDSCESCQSKSDGGVNLETTSVQVPVVDLPIGVTEDRVLGSLDIEQALVFGRKQFEPGLLAKANRGFLYIDEVNLLDDHIVDLLLDVSASGENVVEREGLSVRHPARFVLVGSGNPEEGDLRPQLLDRFGFCVEVASPKQLETRIEAIKRRDAFDRNPIEFTTKWRSEEQLIQKRIVSAQARIASIEVSDDALTLAAGLCLHLGTDGLRGELTLVRAGRSLAAYESAASVTPDHIRAVATMTLAHRLRKDPLDDTSSAARIDLALEQMA